MYLDVEWKDGTVTHVELSNSHTVQVISPDSKVQDAFSLDGVGGLKLNLDGAPAATDPVPPANEGAAEGPTLKVEEALADEGVSSEGIPGQPIPAADPVPAEVPAADPTPPAEPVSDTPSTSETTPTPPGDTPAPPVDDHAAAVDAAATTVAAAQVIVAAPEIAPADKQVQIQTALGDIETALAQYPESAELLDAKAQLEALAGEITTA